MCWSHYANNHSGFCIEFNFSEYLIKTNIEDVYKFKDKDVFLFNIIYEPYILNIDLNRDSKSFNLNEVVYVTKHKYQIWKYEKEIRMITPSKEPLYIEIPKDSIKSITFGFNIFDERVKYLNTRIKNLGYELKTHKLSLDVEYGKLY